MLKIEANSKSELIEVLGRIELHVPGRTDGRTTEDTERWISCRFLSANINGAWIGYPLTAELKDKPDLRVTAPETDIGIEITEVVPKNAAAISAYRDNHNIGGARLLRRHAIDEDPLKGEILREAALSNDGCDGWVGDSVETDWAAAIKRSIERKIENFHKDGFERFGENWLLLYDNWSLPNLHLDKAIIKLICDLEDIDTTCFQKIFIEHGSVMIVLEKGGCREYEIPEICATT